MYTHTPGAHMQSACGARSLRGVCAPVQDAWGRIQWLWDRPGLKRLRITISMAQWSVRLPALLALIATQVGAPPAPPAGRSQDLRCQASHYSTCVFLVHATTSHPLSAMQRVHHLLPAMCG